MLKYGEVICQLQRKFVKILSLVNSNLFKLFNGLSADQIMNQI